MKNIFVELTETAIVKGDLVSRTCWVNMSRVQEMRCLDIENPIIPETITELTMNIPNYVVRVREPPEVILSLLKKANTEKFEVCDD